MFGIINGMRVVFSLFFKKKMLTKHWVNEMAAYVLLWKNFDRKIELKLNRTHNLMHSIFDIFIFAKFQFQIQCICIDIWVEISTMCF